MAEPSTDISPWLDRWGLEPDGYAFSTRWTKSVLLPVRRSGRAAMLKIAMDRTEEAGGAVMAWWDGEGSAPVLAHEGPALLLARAEGPGDLIALAREGGDDEATRIICRAVAGIHRPRPGAPAAGLETAETWFRALRQAAPRDARFARAWAEARALLADPQEQIVLHGDMHHGNVLDFGPLGWRVIDPKGLIGERAYEYANLLRNPDGETAKRPGRVHRQLALIARLADLDPERLRRWTLVHTMLSDAWCLEDGIGPTEAIDLSDFLWAELGP